VDLPEKPTIREENREILQACIYLVIHSGLPRVQEGTTFVGRTVIVQDERGFLFTASQKSSPGNKKER